MDGAKDAGTTVLDTARRNPIPTALIGLGALYLFMKHRDDSKASGYRRSNDYTDYDPPYSAADTGVEGNIVVDEIIIVETDSDGNAQTGSDHTNRRLTAMSNAGTSNTNAGTTLLDTIQRNPLPAALTILGASWLLMKTRDDNRPLRYGDYSNYGQDYSSAPNTGAGNSVIDTVKEKAGQVGDTVSGAVSTAKDRVGDVVSSAKDTVGGVVDSAKEKVGGVVDTTKSKVGDAVDGAKSMVSAAKDNAVRMTGQARDQIGTLSSSALEQTRKAGGVVADTYHDNPMAYGLVALGIGAAVGLMLPGTEQENRLLGQKRDALVGQAQSTVQDIAQKVQTVAEQTLDVAKTTAMQEARHQGLATE